MLNKEVFQRILSYPLKSVDKSDFKLSRRHIYHKVCTIRALLLVQQLNKKVKLPTECFQDLSCLEMVKVPITDCNCLPPQIIQNSLHIYKSKYPIPDVIKSLYGYAVEYVSNLEYSENFDLLTPMSIKYVKGSKYNEIKKFVFFHENHLWAFGVELELLQMKAIFTNPDKIYALEFCGCELPVNCQSYLDRIFPYPLTMTDALIQLVQQEMFTMPNIENNKKEVSE